MEEVPCVGLGHAVVVVVEGLAYGSPLPPVHEHPPLTASVCHSFHDRRRCLYLAFDRATAQIVGGGGKHAVSVSVSVFQQARQGGPNDEGISTVAAGRRDGVRCSLDRRAVFFAGNSRASCLPWLLFFLH